MYLIPASLSVLILLHLHRREIKPSVAHSTRLGAVTLLYASATADVFLPPGLGVFALALGLSLVGAAFGIALRMRALLYAGVTFLIVNVLGQMVRFYPDGRLAKAVMLMALGTAFTADLKREMVNGPPRRAARGAGLRRCEQAKATANDVVKGVRVMGYLT